MTQHNIPPTVSIGMPVYNAGKYLNEALESLLAQTFTDFELIISDNSSTDETADICQQYAKKDARIRYIRQAENLGAIANFQFVLSEAQGEYFMWAAHDDRWLSTFLEQTTAVLKSDKNCGLVFSNIIEKNLENGSQILHQVLPSNHQSAIYNYIIRTLNMTPSLIYGLYRLDTLKNIKLSLFDFADVHFITECAVTTRIQIIDDYLYVAGTKGVREPYSLTHKKLNRTTFLHKQYKLLTKRFHFPISQCLFFLVCLVMLKNKIILWKY